MSAETGLFCCCGGGGGEPPIPPVCCACPTSSYLVQWTGSATYNPTTDCICLAGSFGGCSYNAFAVAIVNVMQFPSFSGPIVVGGTCGGAVQRNIQGPTRNYEFTDPNDPCFCEPTFGGTATLRNYISIKPPRGSAPNCPGGVQSYWEAIVQLPNASGSQTILTYRKNGYECSPGALPLHSVVGSLSGSCTDVSNYAAGSYLVIPGQVIIT